HPKTPPALKLDTQVNAPAESVLTPPDNTSVHRVGPSFAAPTTSDLTRWLRQQGGRAETSMRRLASALGRSPSRVHEEPRLLVASGVPLVASGRSVLRQLSRPN